MSLAEHSTVKDDFEDEFEEETEEKSDGEDTPEKQEKRALKEVDELASKLQFKNKEDNAKKESIVLKDIIKKHQIDIKEEKKKYKQLKKEIDKMAALIQDVDEEEEAEEEETSDEEDESESESEDGSDSEVSQSEDEDAPVDKKKTNSSSRVKRLKNRLKGNFLLKTKAKRLQDDLNEQKDMTASLQEDVDSLLSKLG